MGKSLTVKEVPPALGGWIECIRSLSPDMSNEKNIDGDEKKVGTQPIALPDRLCANLTKGSIVAARAVLLRIAKTNAERRQYRLRLPDIKVELVMGEDGEIEVEYSVPIIKALVGVDATRIRECRVCGKLFWAVRDNQRACSGKCLGTYRGRLWRANRHKEKGGSDFDRILRGAFRKVGSGKKIDPNRPKRTRIARTTSGTGKGSGQGLKMLDMEWWKEQRKKRGGNSSGHEK